MPDNWGYVAFAYAFAALLLGAYWRRLIRKAAELARPPAGRRRRAGSGWPATGTPASRP